MMGKSVFRLDGISVRTDTEVSLSDFTLELSRGEIMGVVGPSDSGKSSLCHVLTGKQRLSGGVLYYHDQPVMERRMPTELTKRVAMIEPQSKLPTSLSVAELLALVNPRRKGQVFLNHRWAYQQAEHILRELSIDIAPDMVGGQLTMAQRHLILIAEACLRHTELIALNNVINAYTEQEWQQIMRTLRIVLKQGIAVLLTSNQDVRMMQICDHIAVLGQRTILKVFEPAEYDLMHRVISQFSNVNRSSRGFQGGHVDEPGLFCAKGVTTPSLRKVDFQVRRGETIGIYDPDNLAGQELFQRMMTLDGGDGCFYLDGRRLDKMDTAAALKQGIAFMPKNAVGSQLFLQQSVLDNILCASRTKLGWSFWFHRRALDHMAKHWAKKLGVQQEDLNARAEQFDYLGRVRIYLSRWYFVRLRIMVCNCPFETADMETTEELKRFLRDLTEKGTAVCLFGYDRKLLQTVCDNVYTLDGTSIRGKNPSETEAARH